MAESHYQSEAKGENITLQPHPDKKEYVVLSLQDNRGQSIQLQWHRVSFLNLFSRFVAQVSEDVWNDYEEEPE